MVPNCLVARKENQDGRSVLTPLLEGKIYAAEGLWFWEQPHSNVLQFFQKQPPRYLEPTKKAKVKKIFAFSWISRLIP